MSSPFAFKLSRYAGLDPDQQAGADARGFEFVNFQDRLVLKMTGNYNAAYNADVLTANQRAARVFEEVVAPVLRLLPDHFNASSDFDAFGFEIAYHARRKSRGFEYESKEILAEVMGKGEALDFAAAAGDMKRQGILNRSEVYLNGKTSGLAIGAREPFEVEALERSIRISQAAVPADTAPGSTTEGVMTAQYQPDFLQGSRSLQIRSQPLETAVKPDGRGEDAARRIYNNDVESLQRKYQPQLDELGKEGATKSPQKVPMHVSQKPVHMGHVLKVWVILPMRIWVLVRIDIGGNPRFNGVTLESSHMPLSCSWVAMAHATVGISAHGSMKFLHKGA